jgi:soluble lytic murein transglycosylase-like protein
MDATSIDSSEGRRLPTWFSTSRKIRPMRRMLARTLCFASTLAVITLSLAAPTKSDFDGSPRYSKRVIQRAISFYAKRYRLEPALLRAVIYAESGFRPDAVSRKGAVGLMQLMPRTAAQLQVHDRYDAIQNIRGGAKQLHHLLILYEGNMRLALAAYNAGVHRIQGYHHIARIPETRNYVKRVLRYYYVFKAAEKQHKPQNLSNI